MTGLLDIASVPAFIQATVQRWDAISDAPLAPDERDELVSEAVVALYELAARYEHHRPGYPRPGSFAGYAARFLPGKLTTAWHRLHPEHIYVTRGGRREWHYLSPAVSLDALAERSPTLLASARPIVALSRLRRPPAGQLTLF